MSETSGQNSFIPLRFFLRNTKKFHYIPNKKRMTCSNKLRVFILHETKKTAFLSFFYFNSFEWFSFFQE
jgi:hypothetical protein